MKKFLLLTLALITVLFCFAACNNQPNDGEDTGTGTDTEAVTVKYDVEAAKAFLKNMYKQYLASPNTPSDYTLVAQVMNNGAVYTIEWSTDNEGIQVIPDEANKQVKIDLDEKTPEDINYKLTATITAPDGSTATLEFDLVVPAYHVSSYDDYYAAEAGDAVVVEGIVVAVHSKEEGNKYNQLYVQDASGVGGYYVYSMDADPAKDLGIKAGMTVSVTGTKDIYSGLHEVKDAVVTVLDSTVKELTPVDITEAYRNAADLKDANLVNKLAMLVTVKGVEITGQDLSEKSMYFKFKLNGLESYIRVYATDCPASVSDEGMQSIMSGHGEHKGWLANVTGVVVVYNGAIYLNPVSADCFEYLNIIERTPAEMLEVEKESITVPSEVHMDTVLELPIKGSTYGDVVITWASDNEAAVVDNATGKVSIYLPKEACTIKLTATLKLGEETITAEYSIAVDAKPTTVPQVVTDFATDTAYKFYVLQAKTGSILYLNGGVDGRYLTTTANVAEAIDVYLESADGGYKIYTMVEGTKQYIEVYNNDEGKTSVRYNADANCVYTYNTATYAWETTVDGTAYYLGTYNTFETISASKTSYITADNTRTEQFPLELVVLVDLSSVSDADMVAAEKPGVTVPKTDFTMDGTMTLPVRGTVYTDVTITWTSDNACAVVNGGSLTVTLQKTAQTVKLTATITCGDVTETLEFTLNVAAKPIMVTDITDAPEADTAYKFYLVQATTGKTLYIDGGVSGRYLTMTDNLDKAVDVYAEKSGDGYKFYILVDGTKQYMEVYLNDEGKTSVRYNAEADCVYTYNATTYAWETTVDGTAYYVGTYSTFETVSASKTSYITADNTRTSQFPLELATIVCGHDYDDGYDTVCNACGAIRTPIKNTDSGSKMVHFSFDEVRTMLGGNETGGLFAPGSAASWDGIATPDASVDALKVWGWVGMTTDTYQFGYIIDDTTFVLSPDFAVEAEAGVVAAAASQGATSASRFAVIVNLADLYGTHNIKVVILQDEEVYVQFVEFTVVLPEKPEEPAEPETLTIPAFNEIGNALGTNNAVTEEKYYVSGIVTEIVSTKYGNMYIKDEAGNTLYIYGLYNADGSARFDAMETPPQVGDYITVLGVASYYNGAQMKNGWMTACVTSTAIPAFNEIANALGTNNAATEDKYLVSGVVTEIVSTKYGNMYVQDSEGNRLYIYGLYTSDGTTRFDAMTVQPKVGDTITVLGVGSYYNGGQMKNGWLMMLVAAPETPEESDS